MTDTQPSNENWKSCPQCGEPVLRDPRTGGTQICPACKSHSSRGAAFGGTAAIAAAVVAVVALVVFSVSILL